MVLSEEEKARLAEAERKALAEKKAHKERILADAAADRDYYNARSAVVREEAAAPVAKVTMRLIFNVDGQSGRSNIQMEGTTETVSLFHLMQAIEEKCHVAPGRQVLKPAEARDPSVLAKPQPRDEPLPPFSAFPSIDDFPMLQDLGLQNGQVLFLTVATPDTATQPAASSSAAAASTAPSAPAASPAAPAPAPRPATPTQPVSKPAPAPAPAPAPTPAPKPAPAPSAGRGTQYSDEHRLKFLWRTIEEQKLNLTKARDARIAVEVDRVKTNPETARLAGLLLWSPKEIDFYAALKADLDRTVGLEPVREFIVQRLRDAAGRHVLKEVKFSRRHVLISGAFGVGKRFAAELIGRLFALICGRLTAAVRVGSRVRLAAWQDAENRGALISKNDLGVVTEEFPPGTAKPFRVQGPSGRFGNYREDELVAEPDLLTNLGALTELLDPKTGKLRVAEKSCYYMRLAGGLTEQDATILEGVLDMESVVIMAGSPEAVEANMQVSAFRRRQPDMLVLPTLTHTDVARLIAVEVEKRGYEGVGEGDVGTPQLVTVLEHIVRQRFDEQLIREKNGHLARDVLDLAISRKNDRTWADSLDSKERFRLTPTDFGLDVLTAEQRERRLQEVETEVGALVGWGTADDVGTPRHFFATLRRQSAGKTGSGAGVGAAAVAGAAAVLHLPRALWVTANAGSGRETFVRLAARFLRACGAISREEVIWIEGPELVAASDPSELLATRLAAAGRGCVAVRDAEALVDAREALRALAASLGSVEGTGGATLAVVLGTPSGMARICRMEPALEAKFPTRVAIPDHTAWELVEFIEQAASDLPSGALLLEQGLAPRLVEHVNETYGGGAQGKELGERGNLGLARRLLQRAVQNRITRLFNRIQEGDSPGESPESERLTVADFEVGAPLGEGTEQKAAIDEEVNLLVGMGKAKDWFQQVRQKVAFVEQTGTRSDLRVCLNIIITGNPGTGKTTFARLLAKFFYTYGVLSKDSFVEKNGLELKAEYMGGTAPRVKAAVQEAMGGCLFLDEAYALMDSSAGIGGGGDAFSQEALRTLLTEVENHRTNLMVVLAGYKEKMGRLLRAEEGLSRRFPGRLHLDDYTPDELAAICETTSRTRHQRDFEPGLREKLARHIENFYWRDIAQQNAGLAVNLTERALDRQIVRIVSAYPQAFDVPLQGTAASAAGAGAATAPLLRQKSGGSIQQVKEEVALFTASDFGIEERPTLGDPEQRAQVTAEVARLTGMANVKAFFQEMSRTVAFVERGGDPRVLQTSLNLRLTGNPGTGKTTVARLIGKYLYAHGVLPRDTFVERNALALKGQFVGQTAPTVTEAVRDAMGGCLFIDEAYALADRGGDKFSGEVVRTLLTEVENHRTGLLVVLAGYADKMDALMDSDPGLRRRFSLELRLEDYSPEELAEICEYAALDRLRLTFTPGLRDKLAKHIREKHGEEVSQHNGGLAVTLAERAFRRLATRLGDPSAGDSSLMSGAAARMLLPEDFEISSSATQEAAPVPASASAACSSGGDVGASAPSAASAAKSLRREEPHGGPLPKRGRKRPGASAASGHWRAAVGDLARGIAEELLRGMAEADLDEDDDEDMPLGGDSSGAGPSREGRTGAIAKARAKAREKEKEKPREVEEEALPIQEGEKVVEEMSTLEALDQLGLCPANFEWFELNVADPPDENCGICAYRLSDGYRCGGGTHFVCMGCISEYKTRRE